MLNVPIFILSMITNTRLKESIANTVAKQRKAMKVNPNKFDTNNDGVVTSDDIARFRDMLEIDLAENKADTQRRMAWTAVAVMTVFTAILFSPFLSDNRVKALSDLLGLFYIAQAGIVGAYMGVTAWMTNNNRSFSRYSYESSYSSKMNSSTSGADDEPTETTDRSINPEVKGRKQ